MAKQHLAYPANLDAKCFGPARQQLFVFRTKLLRHPAHCLLSLFRKRARLHASHRCKHLTVAVASDELDWNVEFTQTRDSFKRHRPGKYIAPDHDLVHVCSTNIFEQRLQCRQVRMNIIDRGHPPANQ